MPSNLYPIGTYDMQGDCTAITTPDGRDACLKVTFGLDGTSVTVGDDGLYVQRASAKPNDIQREDRISPS